MPTSADAAAAAEAALRAAPREARPPRGGTRTGMVLERAGDGPWRLLEAGPPALVREVDAGEGRRLLVCGSRLPGTDEWVAGRLRRGGAPAQVFRAAWEELEGHFALALLDEAGDRLWLGTDAYAIAKVYVHDGPGRRVAGTTLAGVLERAGPAARALHPEAATYFLLQGYTPGAHTFFQGVRKLAPGRLLEFRGAEAREQTWHELPVEASLSPAEYQRRVRARWERSLRAGLEAAGRHRVALSGGIDSTTLLAGLLRLGADPARLDTATAVPLGGPGGAVVLNPYDVRYARRVAADLGVKHHEVPYRWDAPAVLDDFRETVAVVEGSDAMGAGLFRALLQAPGLDGGVLHAAQNADSVFSFASTGWPALRRFPPFLTGLGGWAARHNLFDAGAPRRGPMDRAAAFLLDAYLRRRYGVAWKERTPEDRLLGLVFNPHKWPVVPPADAASPLSGYAATVAWFAREYLHGMGVLERFGTNPHAVLLWTFLHTFMQGRDNRSTVWPTAARGVPTLLPFASEGVLRLTAALRPGLAHQWYGKHAVLRLARDLGVPGYVLRRVDPNAPELDRLALESFFRNDAVHAFLAPLFAARAPGRLAGVLHPRWLEGAAARLAERRLDGLDLPLLLRACWILVLDDLTPG